MLVPGVTRQGQNDLRERAGAVLIRARGHLHDRVQADVGALDQPQHLRVGGLHRGAHLQGIAQHARHLDDAFLLVLGRRHHHVARPAGPAARLGQALRGAQVTREHPPVQIRQLERGRSNTDLDVGQFVLDPLGGELPRLVHVGDAVVAERAGVGTSASRLHHRGQAVVEELVQQARGVGRGQRGVQVQNTRQGVAANEPVLTHVMHAGDRYATAAQAGGVEPDVAQRVEQVEERDFALPVGEEVDLRVRCQIALLLVGLDRVVGSAHHHDRARRRALDRPAERAGQLLVPHVVGEAADRRLVAGQEARERRWVLEQAWADVATEVLPGVGGNVADGQGIVVGVDGDGRVREIGERDESGHWGRSKS